MGDDEEYNPPFTTEGAVNTKARRTRQLDIETLEAPFRYDRAS
jgi:hypothetical protein